VFDDGINILENPNIRLTRLTPASLARLFNSPEKFPPGCGAKPSGRSSHFYSWESNIVSNLLTDEVKQKRKPRAKAEGEEEPKTPKKLKQKQIVADVNAVYELPADVAAKVMQHCASTDQFNTDRMDTAVALHDTGILVAHLVMPTDKKPNDAFDAAKLGAVHRTLCRYIANKSEAEDKEKAAIFANEVAEVRKLLRFLCNVELAIERVVLRLETIKELSDVVSDLKPALKLLQSVSQELFNVLPDVSTELSEVNEAISETLYSTRITADETIIPVNRKTLGGEEILKEVIGLLDDRHGIRLVRADSGFFPDRI
jgi:hypothetical protein